MSASTVLKLATVGNARALGIEQQTGSLEAGKKADVIVVDVAKPHLTPMYNPFSHLVYAVRGSDVRHSVINGRVVMENRELILLDLGDVMDSAVEMSRNVIDWLEK